jgi:DNA-directed RNA polymerase specialized sigma24 family protein
MLQYILKLTRLREKIRQQIAGMPNPIHRQILFRYYLGCQSFERIAADLGYSYQYVINAHGRALQAFEKMYLKSSE